MGRYSGKRLLVLGTNVMAPDMVTYARSEGALTYVVDFYPVERSRAKQLADYNADISTADTESIIKYAVENKIDGVVAGIHEFNILQAKKVADALGMPFYFNQQQWDIFQNKDSFRQLCRDYEVPSPKTYFMGGDTASVDYSAIEYPVIVKPVDNGASIGINICKNEAELRAGVEEALKESDSKRIIIEKFEKGVEFTAHYTISKGVVTLSCLDNRYPVAVHEGMVTTIPGARVYPCRYLDKYLQHVNASVIRMIESLKLVNAVVFLQGLYDEETESFNVFEAGLRSAAEAPYRILDRVNGVNYMHLLVDNALSVEPDFRSEQENPNMKGKCAAIVSMITKGGTVGSITGLEEALEQVSSVVDHEVRYPVGMETPCGDTLRQIMIRFIMICDSVEDMMKDISYLNEHIEVKDTNGENMVIKFEPERLMGIV